LVIGIVLRTIGVWGMLPYLIIILGAFSKITYIVLSMKNNKYKAGYELLVLYSGLLMFFCGLYFRNNHSWEYAQILIFTGITFKILFVVLFVRKLRLKLQKQSIDISSTRIGK